MASTENAMERRLAYLLFKFATACFFVFAVVSSAWSASFTYELFTKGAQGQASGGPFLSWGIITFEGSSGDAFPNLDTTTPFNLISPYSGAVYTQLVGLPRTGLRSFDGHVGGLGDSLVTADWISGGGIDTFWQFFTERFSSSVLFDGAPSFAFYREEGRFGAFELSTSLLAASGFPLPSLDLSFDLSAPAWYLQLDAVTNPIPEPETYAMLLAGLLGLGFATWRQKLLRAWK